MEKFNFIEENLNKKEDKKRKANAERPDFYKETGQLYAQKDVYEYDGYDILEEEDTKDLIESLRESEAGTDLSEEEKIFARFKFKNLREFFKNKKAKEDELLFLELRLDKLIQKELQNKASDTFSRNSRIDKLDVEIEKIKTEISELSSDNPEAFYAAHTLEIKKYKQQLESGKPVEVSYVRGKMDEVLENMKTCKPVFLHGHLGSGKSVIAYATAREFMIEENVQKDFDEWYRAEIEKLRKNGERKIERFNPETKKFEEFTSDEKINKKEVIRKVKDLKNFYQNDKSEETEEKIKFYAISGSKEISVSDLYTSKSLGLEKVNGKSISEHSEILAEERKKWLDKNKEELNSLNEKEKDEKMKQGFADISQIYEMKNSGFGTVVKEIKMELRKAIEEGRPFVFDEINAVPVEVLISMNDLLTKKPGDEAFVPGVGNVKIAKGFSAVFTGNINLANLAEYHGVNELNPAFLSRLENIEFDYPPQRVDGKIDSVPNGDNEIFKILVAKSVDKNGNINLPEGSLNKLHKLAIYAAKVQKLFSGKWKESRVGEVDGIEPRLEQSVLSIRALSNIMDKWSAGRKMDLDMAIWKGFIDNATVPSDKNILVKIAQDVGFFQDSEGWKLNDTAITDSTFLNLKDIQKDSYKFKKQETQFMSVKKAVETLYGNPPRRTEFPDMETKNEEKETIDTEKYQELEDFISNIDMAEYEEAEKEACGL